MKQNSNWVNGLYPVLFIVAAFFFRLPVLNLSTVDWDETTYLILGKTVVDGHFPYVYYWDLKPIGTYLIYSVFILFFGYDIFTIRIATVLFSGLSAYLLFLILKKRDRLTAIIGGFLFLYLITKSGDSGLSGNTEIFFIPFEIAGFYFFTGRRYFVSGLSFGIAFIVKYIIVYDAFFLGCIISFATIRLVYGTKNYKEFLKPVLYGLGFVFPFSLVAFAYFITGNWNAYLEPILIAISKYGTGDLERTKLDFIFSYIKFIYPLVLIFLLGFATIPIKRYFRILRSDRFLILIGLNLTSLYASTWTGYLFDHYYLQVLPFSILLSFGFLRFSLPARTREKKIITYLGFAALLVLSFQLIKSSYKEFHKFEDVPKQVATYIKEKDEKATLFVGKGWHASYVYLDMLPPVRYIQPSCYTSAPFRSKFNVDLDGMFSDLGGANVHWIQWADKDLLSGDFKSIDEYKLRLRDYLLKNSFYLDKEFAYNVKLYKRKTEK